ncbi:glycosyltransferase family 4 protein [Polynucleobacter sp. 80A-SIGWE]|uniref:glycosyltransferase family 4 protein n=1 Tax=Polynucleobacter sp. 80A-SIGWE TaxID=2689100 RepID=UPI001C0C1E81|nr:glycosyltransferase family 4 protein [Polynucleobacter sp. 80A-SIGWE]MBU3589081.1 glycosyltransferase family 4 protein [Polynucleobacter sp. 80A-SIGWE]
MICILYCGKIGGGVNDLKNLVHGLRESHLLDANIEIFSLYKIQAIVEIVSQTNSKYVYCIDKHNGLISEIFANLKALFYLLKLYIREVSVVQVMPHPLDLFHSLLCKFRVSHKVRYFFIRHNPIGFRHVNSKIRNLFISYIDEINTRRADGILFFSKSVMDGFSRDPLISSKCRYIGFGYNRFGSKENLNMVCKSPAILLFFGRILPYKGLDDLLRSLKFVRNNVKLIIAGKELTETQKILISELDVPVDIYNEWISDSLADQLYSIADIVVLPYRLISQSGPLLTAIGYQVPVIAPDLVGVKEFITDGINGLLFKAGDISDLARKIDQIIPDDQYLKLKAKSRLLRDDFEWKSVAVRFVEAINSVHN